MGRGSPTIFLVKKVREPSSQGGRNVCRQPPCIRRILIKGRFFQLGPFASFPIASGPTGLTALIGLLTLSVHIFPLGAVEDILLSTPTARARSAAGSFTDGD